jgi:hypothetical protein
MAGNLRGLEMRLLVRYAGGNHHAIIDYGGDINWHLKNANINVHCCSPEIDLRDSRRLIEHNLSFLRNIATHKSPTVRAAVDLYKEEPTRFVCRNYAQHCSKRADVAIACHSLYDMTLEDIADAMISHDNKILYACVLFSYDTLAEDSGIISGVDAYFAKRKDSKGQTFIDFSFVNDSSNGYSHNFAQYRRLFITNVFKHRGYVFLIEMMENRLGVQYIKIVRVSSVSAHNDYYFHRIWNPARDKKIMIRTFSFRYTHKSDSRNKLVVKWRAISKKLAFDTRSYLAGIKARNSTSLKL